MKISPRGPYHTMHSRAFYEVVDEGFDWYLLKNGTYIFKNLVKVDSEEPQDVELLYEDLA